MIFLYIYLDWDDISRSRFSYHSCAVLLACSWRHVASWGDTPRTQYHSGGVSGCKISRMMGFVWYVQAGIRIRGSRVTCADSVARVRF